MFWRLAYSFCMVVLGERAGSEEGGGEKERVAIAKS